MTDNVKNFMREFEAKIEDAEIYMVGGCVRDFVMGREPHDFDFCTNVCIDEMEPHFNCVNIGQSKDFGITSIQYNGESFEVAQMRSEGDYTNHRHPDCLEFDVTLKQDLARRDFTMNAIAMDVDGNISDPYNGRDDIKRKVIMCVGDPHARFEEDALRILRALRFSASLDFNLDSFVERAIMDHSESIKTLSQERITGEIRKVAQKGGKVFYRFLKLIEENFMMDIIFPEIEIMKGYKQYWLHHPEGCKQQCVETGVISPLSFNDIAAGTHKAYECGTVYDHQMSVMSMIPEDVDEFVVLGALWHDVGKPMTAEWKDDELGTSSFQRHEYKGVALFDEIAKKRKIGGLLRESIKFCIGKHMNMNDRNLSKKSTIINMAMNPCFDTLVEVSRADDMSRNVNGNVLYIEEEFDRNLQKFLDARDTYVDDKVFKAKIAKFIDGNKVMELCGLKPCKKVGTIIEVVTECIIEKGFNVSQAEIDFMIINLGKCSVNVDGTFDMSGV